MDNKDAKPEYVAAAEFARGNRNAQMIGDGFLAGIAWERGRNPKEALVAALQNAVHRVRWQQQFHNECKDLIDDECAEWLAIIKSSRVPHG